MTIAEMLRACGGEWTGPEDRLNASPADIVTDSRQAGKGSLFLAFRGERTDGHRYIPDVLAKGALAVLCEERGEPGEPRIVVPEILPAMRQIARANREHCAFPFVGVTGSVGKTTAKEMIAACLSAHGPVFKTPGSMNSQIGLPAALMALEPVYSAAVIEMGISQFGEMTRLTKVVEPEIAVFTNIGDAHLEFLHDRAGVLKAKSEILLGMKAEGVVIVNGDDPLLRLASFERKKITFGLSEGCDVWAEEIDPADGTELRCRVRTADRSFSVSVPAYGSYMIYSVLAAAAAGMELGLSDEEIALGLGRFQTVGRRSRVVKTPLYTLIDDCYNANPTSNRAAIDSLSNLSGRKVCILGDMREMGENSPELHRQIGRYAAEHGASLLITQGEDAAHIGEGAPEITRHFDSKDELIRTLPELLRPGDAVLVKASHGARFDDIADAIENLR